MSSSIGVEKSLIQGQNGQQEIYDNENVKIKNNVLYTQKGQYKIDKTQSLKYGSMKYIVSSLMQGGKTETVRDVAAMGDIGMFLTNDQEVDKQLLKFVSKEYKRKYKLDDIKLDNIKLEYNYSQKQKQAYSKDMAKELKYRYNFYDNIQKNYNGGGIKWNYDDIIVSREKQKKSKKYFNMDYNQFMKYRDSVVGAKLYVEDAEDFTGGGYETGGCDCLDNLNDPIQVPQFKFQQTGGDVFNLGRFLDESIKKSYKKVNSNINKYVINAYQEAYNQMNDVQQNGDDTQIDDVENKKVPKGSDDSDDYDSMEGTDDQEEKVPESQDMNGGEDSLSDYKFNIV